MHDPRSIMSSVCNYPRGVMSIMYTSLANGGHPPSHGTSSVGQSFGAKNETLGVHPIAFQGVDPMTSQMRCSLNLTRVRRREGSEY